MANIFIICPVRNCPDKLKNDLYEYVKNLEQEGHNVHFNMRDVNQNQEGFDICLAHKDAMWNADEVHIYWDKNSTGSHFDLGMAFAIMDARQCFTKFVIINDILERTPHKSYQNVVIDLSKNKQYPCLKKES